jgi:hypothetical protein
MAKGKPQAVAQGTDSVTGGGWNGWSRRLAAVPAGPITEAQFNRGMLGGVLAHKLGYKCPITIALMEEDE